MKVAQDLYEAGHITYMRTDSTNLSETALNGAEAAITASFGANYHQRQTYSKAAKGAQEAHEAIRPTDFNAGSLQADRDQARLYELIWKRAIASQMAHAKLENTTAHIDVAGRTEHFVAKGQVITFDGFLKVYLEDSDDEQPDEHDKDRLPAMEVGQILDRQTIVATERFSKHPPRYSEASLVKRLEELGIGRPSTYAPTISTVQKRGYVEKRDLEGTPRPYHVLEITDGKVVQRTETEMTGADRNKLMPTDIGSVVNDFLHEHFENILDFNFTANVENEFDQIAQGQLNWRDMLKDFYKPFKTKVDEVIDVGERPKDRVLGTDPESGKPVIVRIGRFGPIAQIGEANDEEKQFASLLKEQSIETITLEAALELFKLPRRLGEHDGKVVTAAIGRFGPYVRYDGKFVSLKAADGDDPHTITLTRALELIQAKMEADAQALIKVFEEDPDTRILNGRFGPYIKHGKKNVTIPKTEDPAGIDWARALELIEEHAKKPKRKPRKS
jgi:DNA topoisomerase I